MTRWVFNVGDPVYFFKGDIIIEGYILASFIWKGSRHFVVGDEKEFYVHEGDIRPNKKGQPLVMPSRKGVT